MNKIRVHTLDLSIPRRYEPIYDPCKFIYIPTPKEGVYLSLEPEGYLIDLSRVNEFFFTHGIEEFYITNETQDGVFHIITGNCGVKFEDTYSLVEVKELIKEINKDWKNLLGESE